MADERITSQLPAASSVPFTVEHETALDYLKSKGTAWAHNLNTERTPGESTTQQFPETLTPSVSGAGPVKQSLARKIAAVALVAYIWGVTLSFPYFSWKFIKENSFLSWLFLGEFVPAGKSLIWPYYAGSSLLEKGWTKEEKENLAHSRRSAKAVTKALILGEGFDKTGRIAPTDATRLLELVKEALDESKLVRDDVLAKVHPDYPKNYREKYERGLVLIVQFTETGQDDDFATAQRLLNEWNDWVDAHREGMSIPKDLPE